ncbi:MAG: putative glucose-6-phosphate 1-epimerase [Pedosphaera sp.]|nr:putative glucose-6-phosphate 1-epimerase [Pedosphaera sp.]
MNANKTSEFNQEFGTGRASFMKRQGGLPMIRVETTSSEAEIYLHGAHVTHFQKRGEAPLLWLSKESRFEAGSPIRGGVPIILPWFGAREGAPAHGFARVKDWELKEIGLTADGSVRVHLQLPPSAEAAAFTPFTADYFVTVGDKLELQLVIANNSDDRELMMEECLHSYFAVGDISEIAVAGLKGLKYLDKVGGSVEMTETNEVITVASEVDRVYMDTTGTVEILDRKLRRKISVEKEGSAATVVWNPWIAKSKAMADFGDEEYHEMICVETGNVGKNRLTLAAGKTAVMVARIYSETTNE